MKTYSSRAVNKVTPMKKSILFEAMGVDGEKITTTKDLRDMASDDVIKLIPKDFYNKAKEDDTIIITDGTTEFTYKWQNNKFLPWMMNEANIPDILKELEKHLKKQNISDEDEEIKEVESWLEMELEEYDLGTREKIISAVSKRYDIDTGEIGKFIGSSIDEVQHIPSLSDFVSTGNKLINPLNESKDEPEILPTFEDFQQKTIITDEGEFREGIPVEITKKGIYKGKRGTINAVSHSGDSYEVDYKDEKGNVIGTDWFTAKELKSLLNESKQANEGGKGNDTINRLMYYIQGGNEEQYAIEKTASDLNLTEDEVKKILNDNHDEITHGLKEAADAGILGVDQIDLEKGNIDTDPDISSTNENEYTYFITVSLDGARKAMDILNDRFRDDYEKHFGYSNKFKFKDEEIAVDVLIAFKDQGVEIKDANISESINEDEEIMVTTSLRDWTDKSDEEIIKRFIPAGSYLYRKDGDITTIRDGTHEIKFVWKDDKPVREDLEGENSDEAKKNLEPAYLKGLESGEKFLEFIEQYGEKDDKTQYWKKSPYDEGSPDDEFFKNGFNVSTSHKYESLDEAEKYYKVGPSVGGMISGSDIHNVAQEVYDFIKSEPKDVYTDEYLQKLIPQRYDVSDKVAKEVIKYIRTELEESLNEAKGFDQLIKSLADDQLENIASEENINIDGFSRNEIEEEILNNLSNNDKKAYFDVYNEGINEAKEMDSQYLQKRLDDLAKDAKKNKEEDKAEVYSYLSSRLNQSYPGGDVSMVDIEDLLKHPSIRKAWANIPSEVIDDLFNESLNEDSPFGDMAGDWEYKEALDYAEKLIDVYGQPDAISSESIIWNNPDDNWGKIEIRDEAIPHQVPAPHNDFVYGTVKLEIEDDMVDEIAAISDSVIVDQLKGEVTARCGAMIKNAITVNIVKEVVDGTISAEEAVEVYPERIKSDEVPDWYEDKVGDLEGGDDKPPAPAPAPPDDEKPEIKKKEDIGEAKTKGINEGESDEYKWLKDYKIVGNFDKDSEFLSKAIKYVETPNYPENKKVEIIDKYDQEMGSDKDTI